jgi:hypothetical protein
MTSSKPREEELMTTRDDNKFAGIWFAQVSYPAMDDRSEETTKNRMVAHQQGNEVVFTSVQNQEGSYMVIRMSIADNTATGTWHETTSPTGKFGGAMYSGAGQLVIDDDAQCIQGQWAGMGLDRTENKPRVYTGRWKLTRGEE